jgi:hypothetical protein
MVLQKNLRKNYNYLAFLVSVFASILVSVLVSVAAAVVAGVAVAIAAESAAGAGAGAGVAFTVVVVAEVESVLAASPPPLPQDATKRPKERASTLNFTNFIISFFRWLCRFIPE